MPIPLSPTLQAALIDPVRRPVCAVVVDPAGVARDVTADVLAWHCERRSDQRAGTATIVLADPDARYAELRPGMPVVIRRGLRTTVGNETVPVFTGEIAATDAAVLPGGRATRTLRLLDRAGRAVRTDITTPCYTNTDANAIVAALFTNYGGIAPADIALLPISPTIPRLQCVGETLMDAGVLLMQAARRRIAFDAAGRLCSAALVPTGTPAWTLDDPAQLIAIADTRQPPACTQCTVIGAMRDPQRQVGVEVLWEEVTAQDYDYGITIDVPFRPDGAVYEEIRLEVATPLTPYEQVALYAVRGDGITLKVVSPAGRAITVRCYGKQVFYTTPYVTATAADPALHAAWGARRLEVDNGALHDAATAQALANDLLTLARWAQRTLTVTLLAHPGLDPGDRVQFHHPHTGETLTLLLTTVTHRATPGQEDATVIEGLVADE